MERLGHSRAKEREIARQRRYFEEDIEQPWTPRFKRNRKFEKIYGRKIYALEHDN